jgi:predicted lysophospholipase L1 biosynthesis ABC-type transport system permease subunit
MANMEANIEATDNFTYSQLPTLRKVMELVNRQMEVWGGATLAILSLIALALLTIRRNHLAWMLLGVTYVYFTVIVGFSIWQGSRLHYSAEMAWSILLAYLIVQMYNSIFRRRLRTRVIA